MMLSTAGGKSRVGGRMAPLKDSRRGRGRGRGRGLSSSLVSSRGGARARGRGRGRDSASTSTAGQLLSTSGHPENHSDSPIASLFSFGGISQHTHSTISSNPNSPDSPDSPHPDDTKANLKGKLKLIQTETSAGSEKLALEKSVKTRRSRVTYGGKRGIGENNDMRDGRISSSTRSSNKQTAQSNKPNNPKKPRLRRTYKGKNNHPRDKHSDDYVENQLRQTLFKYITSAPPPNNPENPNHPVGSEKQNQGKERENKEREEEEREKSEERVLPSHANAQGEPQQARWAGSENEAISEEEVEEELLFGFAPPLAHNHPNSPNNPNNPNSSSSPTGKNGGRNGGKNENAPLVPLGEVLDYIVDSSSDTCDNSHGEDSDPAHQLEGNEGSEKLNSLVEKDEDEGDKHEEKAAELVLVEALQAMDFQGNLDRQLDEILVLESMYSDRSHPE